MKPVTTLRRRGAVVASAVVAAVLAVPAAAPAEAPLRAQTGAGALQRYLASHDNHVVESDFPSYGVTLDAVIAMDAAGIGDYRSEKVTQYVADHVGEYVGDGTTESYAGALGKALVVSTSQGRGASLGGVNLVTRVKAREQSNGRFTDASEFGDYSNVITQSFDLVGLVKAGERLSYNSIAFLRQQQCSDGGFRLDPDDTTCTSDPDATSFAVQGLLAAPQTTVTKRRIAKAVTYLHSRMNSSGGIGGGPTTTAANSNSTGLAVWAFEATGKSTWADKGRDYLRGLRYACAFPTTMRGAIAYNSERRREAAGQGNAATLTTQDVRATAQAVLGFVEVSMVDVTNKGAKYSSPRVSC